GRIYIDFNYNNPLAHKIMAGCDIFLMPSRFEPCGITQMYSLKYGTVPIVRKTGGLADTVSQWNGKEGTGFVFNDFTTDAFLKSVTEAIRTFRKRDVWNKIIHNGMLEDFSWEHSANEYIKLYEKVKKNETRIVV
ncbi:MAG: glycosyltransferase, partial [Candidatus Marinimicrobia bacterium]|nr:glycosyltransferase [Candidatus Neomarinimicrobiota bacterium]